MRKQITVPAAGAVERVKLTGRSIVIENCGVFDNIEDVPLMNLGSHILGFPIYPRSVYPSPGVFNYIEIIGTAESAGTKIDLLSTDQCLELDLNIITASQYRARVGTSFEITSTDAGQTIPELSLVDSDGNLPNKIYVSARVNDLVFAFGVTPDQDAGGLGTVLPDEGAAVPIDGINFIQAFTFRSKVAATHGILTVHLEYKA